MPDLYMIVNPSDPYTIQGDRETVCAAVLLLGEGAYGVQRIGGDQVLPLYAFWNSDAAEEDWRKRFGRTMEQSLTALRDQIPEALETVLIGSCEDRERMERVLAAVSSPEEREKARAAWHDGRRSSMNDIGARAASLARGLRPRPAGERQP